MILYADMMNDILPEVSGCSIDIAINALRNTCIEFYKKTWIKRVELTPFSTVVGVNEYQLSIEEGAQIVGIVSVYANGRRIDPISEDIFNQYSFDWTTQTGDVTGYLQTEPDLIALYRTPIKTEELKITAAIAPNRFSDSIDDFVYDQYSEGLAAGAKARIMAMPKRPYSDLEGSATYRGQFTEALSNAKWATRKSLVSSQLAVAMRRVY